jgi:hypothetical protein
MAPTKVFDSLFLLVIDSIWLQHNAKVFRGAAVNAWTIIVAVSQACRAGTLSRSELLGL